MMKGVVLAGGTGTRLGILTKVVNKHLLPIYDKPMIAYPLQTMIDLGIKSIMIVTDKSRAGDFMNLLGNGRELGVRFTYGLQDKAAGIADAISVAKDFAGDDDITVILGDNIFLGKIPLSLQKSRKAKIFLKKVNDPERYGIAFLEGGRISKIVEKPRHRLSDLAVTGLYQYPPDVFELIDTISPSHRNELEITELNLIYLKHERLEYEILDIPWVDAGTIESLYQAQKIVRDLSYKVS